MSELYLDILNGFKEIAQMQGKFELESHINELASGSSIEMTESLDQMREKALKMKETSNAFAILYGYRVKDKEVELEPEEFATEEEYRDRVKQITGSFTKLSDKDPRGNRYGKEHNIEFYTVYPNKKQVSESTAINNNWKVKKSRIDTKKIDSIINDLISSFPIIGSKPATIFKRHYK